MKKILITGGAGYIGSLLTTDLVKLGHKVTVVDLLKYSSSSLNHLYNFKNFDFVHAHNSIYVYNLRDMIKIIRIINYISKKSHITIPAYTNDSERLKFLKWTLTGTTILHEKEWKKLFKYLGYKGDYYFSGAKSFGL